MVGVLLTNSHVPTELKYRNKISFSRRGETGCVGFDNVSGGVKEKLFQGNLTGYQRVRV